MSRATLMDGARGEVAQGNEVVMMMWLDKAYLSHVHVGVRESKEGGSFLSAAVLSVIDKAVFRLVCICSLHSPRDY